MELAWDRLTAEALRDLAARDAIAILPVASTEQHGPHLPTGVDSTLCGAVARRAAERVAKKRAVVVAPTLWCGLAEHHMAFGGTFTLSFSTYRALLFDLCRSIIRHGFRRVLILNGHGGNMTALNVIGGELARELDAPIAVATYWLLADEAFAEILEDQVSVLHACEAESSMMLALASDLVAMDRAPEGAKGTRAGAALNPPLGRWRSFAEITGNGVLGDARRASAEKGERLLAAAAGALADRLIAGEPWD